MLAHTGIRPLWPVVAFLPWLLVGVGYLLRSVLKPRIPAAPDRECEE